MKLLNQIPSKEFCAIDVETVRIEEHYEDLSEQFKSAWEYKNKNKGKVPTQEELAVMWTETSSFYAEFSKVCAVSLAFLDATETNLMVKEIYGEDEGEILRELGGLLERMQYKGGFRLVGHASKYFDYPFLCKRYVINGEDIPSMLDSSTLKPWEQRNLDTNMDIWKMGGTGPGSSLQALCTALGLPISKVDLVGDEVGRVYFEGDFKRIGRYCSYDTIATFNILRRIKKEGIFEFDDVVYMDEEVQEEEVKKPNLLQRLYNDQVISLYFEEELLSRLQEQKPNKKDWDNLEKMVYGTLINEDFVQMNQDNKKTLEEKEINTENLIQRLKTNLEEND